MHARIPEMKRVAKMIRNHWEGILNYWTYRRTNALLEGLNSIIQNIKRRARGFRNPEYFKTMIYLVAGNLDFSRWTQALNHTKRHRALKTDDSDSNNLRVIIF